ncbi:MAG: hypothetical protein WD603_03025 [Patescibacteria group bacterium]
MSTISPPATPIRDGASRLIEEARRTRQPTPLTRIRVLDIGNPDIASHPYTDDEQAELYDTLFRNLGITQHRIEECALEHARDGRLTSHYEVSTCDSLSVFIQGWGNRPGFDLYLAPAGYRQT